MEFAGVARYACVAAVFLSGCYRHMEVVKEMRWKCGSGRDPWQPHHTLELRYVDAPSYIEFLTGDGICGKLSASAGSTVRVRFNVWGNGVTGLKGYHIVAVNDVNVLLTHSGAAKDGDGGNPEHPLSRTF